MKISSISLLFVQRYRQKRKSMREIVVSLYKQYPLLKKIVHQREGGVLVFVFFIFLVLFLRLFIIQVIQSSSFDAQLVSQHTRVQTILPSRWHIFVTDRWGNTLQLTENIKTYTLYIDPEFVWNKPKVVSLLVPLVYSHLCVVTWLMRVTDTQCLQNLSLFTRKNYLPVRPQIFYYASWYVSENFFTFDANAFDAQTQRTIQDMTQDRIMNEIEQRLNELIVQGDRPLNYLWFFTSELFLQALQEVNLPWVVVQNTNYVFLEPARVTARTRSELARILLTFGFRSHHDRLSSLFEVQRNRYVQIVTNLNPAIAEQAQKLKAQYFTERSPDRFRIPLLHGLGMDSATRRYYRYEDFMSHIIGYVNSEGQGQYGVEEYFDTQLAGRRWRIAWRSSVWMGTVGAHDFSIDRGQDGSDIYLTIDPTIQREVERIASQNFPRFNPDSISVLVYDPYKGHIKASANYPSFNPNRVSQAFTLRPLGIEDRRLLENETFVDVPVFARINEQMLNVTRLPERFTALVPKFIYQNIFGPTVLVDKNISFPYDPGSIFKTITYAIGLDLGEFREREVYEDPEGFVMIDQFRIANASSRCTGTHSFLYALQYSCNVWMVRIIQRITRFTFYHYLQALWFGSITWIELAGEEPWFVESPTTVATARFLNNSFGLWLLVTPLQMAAAYGTLLNSWVYMKPTIVDKICNQAWCITNHPKAVRQVFSPQTARDTMQALFDVIHTEGNFETLSVPGLSLGWKSGTSSVVYRWQYMRGEGWTNGSYVGYISRDNPRYVVVVQVRRPRSSQRWWETAGPIFKEVATFLANYEFIES